MNERNIVFRFTRSIMSKQYNLGRTSTLNCQKKTIIALDKMPTYAEAIADVIQKCFCWVFGSFFFFFDDVLPREAEKFWNRLGILLPRY